MAEPPQAQAQAQAPPCQRPAAAVTLYCTSLSVSGKVKADSARIKRILDARAVAYEEARWGLDRGRLACRRSARAVAAPPLPPPPLPAPLWPTALLRSPLLSPHR